MQRKRNAKITTINISILEENFATYEKWLEKTNRQDGIENYKKFLIIGIIFKTRV